MTMIASWDGQSLELWDGQGERKFVFAPVPPSPEPVSDEEQQGADTDSSEANQAGDALVEQTGSVLSLSHVDSPVAALLLPVEALLQRPFSLPFEHPRFIDAAMLGQELADQAGVEEDDWWLCWVADKAEQGVRGLVFALPENFKTELSVAPIAGQCPYIGPDIAVRLASHLKADMTSAAVLDADAEGLMFGVYVDGIWRGMRRLNLSLERENRAMLAQEACVSLNAMGFDAATMPLIGRLDAFWKQAFDSLAQLSDADWKLDIQKPKLDVQKQQVEVSEQGAEEAMCELPTRHAANASAMASLAGTPLFNFRHDAWAIQTDWSKRIGPWRRAALLAAALCLLMIGQDAWQLSQLREKQEVARLGIENAFHQALPGVAMIDPMLQLRQAAGGGGDSEAWGFIRHLDAISKLSKKETAFVVQNISYATGEVLLSGMVPDFAAANRIRDALATILRRKVELLDTDLSDKQVRVRLRWSS